MTRKKITITILIAWLALIAINIFRRDEIFTKTYNTFFQEIKRFELIDNRYNTLITKVCSTVASAMGITESVLVNATYSSNDICIFVLNPHLFQREDNKYRGISLKSRRMIRECRDNFIYYEPNVVLIDSKFLSLLIITSYNSTTAFAQAMDTYMPFINEADSLARLLGINISDSTVTNLPENISSIIKTANDGLSTANNLDTYLRMGNIQYYNEEDKWFQSGTYWFENLDSSTASIAKHFSSDTLVLDDSVDAFKDEEYLLPTIFTVSSHEFAHHIISDYHIWDFSSFEGFRYYFESIFNEELIADALSTFNILEYAESLKGLKQGIFLNGITDSAELLRDIVLVDIYNGFRGFRAQDLFITIEEHDPLPEYAKQAPFTWPDRIKYASWHPTPLLTIDELVGLMGKVRRKGIFSTHEELLVRGYSITFNLAQEFPFFTNTFYGYEELLETPIRKKGDLRDIYSKMSEHDAPSGRGTGLSKNDVLNYIGDDFDIYEAISVKGNECWVGYSKESRKNILEIYGPGNNVLKASMYHHYPDETFSAQQTRDLMPLINFVNNIAPEIWDTVMVDSSEFLDMLGVEYGKEPEIISEKFNSAYTRFMEGLRNKQYPTMRIEAGNNVLTLGSVNNTSTFRVSIEARQ